MVFRRWRRQVRRLLCQWQELQGKGPDVQQTSTAVVQPKGASRMEHQEDIVACRAGFDLQGAPGVRGVEASTGKQAVAGATMRELLVVLVRIVPCCVAKCFHTSVTLCPHLCAQGTAMWLPAASCAPTATASLSLEWSTTQRPGESDCRGGWAGGGKGLQSARSTTQRPGKEVWDGGQGAGERTWMVQVRAGDESGCPEREGGLHKAAARSPG